MQNPAFDQLRDDQAAHIVLDLETLSTQPNALVLSIGAVGLNRHGQRLPNAEFHTALDQQAQQHRRHVELETQQWWQENTCAGAKAASLHALASQQFFVEGALAAFADFIDHWSHRDLVCIWGNGSSFDNVILASLYRDWGKETPWNFRNDRDLRTILGLFPIIKKKPFFGIKHHALHDARHEANQLSAAMQLLNQALTLTT